MTKTFKHILEATERPTYAKLKWQSGAERDKAFAKMLRHYPNTKHLCQEGCSPIYWNPIYILLDCVLHTYYEEFLPIYLDLRS